MRMRLLSGLVFAACLSTLLAYPHSLSHYDTEPLQGPLKVKKDLPSILYGGWLFVYQGVSGGGTPPAFLHNNTNLLLVSFMDPSNLTMHPIFVQAVEAYGKNHIMMLSVGGLAYGPNWKFLSDNATSSAAAMTLVNLAHKYNFDGIDVDAEGTAESCDPLVMANFLLTLRKYGPDLLISFCVYGNPEGRDMHNYQINNLMNNVPVIDFINIMGYGGYDADVQYIQSYHNAPVRQWQPPIVKSVPFSKILTGMKGTKGFPSCDPVDYEEMAAYVVSNQVRGIGIWGFVNDNSSLPLEWYDPSCIQGYISLCRDLHLPNCSANSTQSR